MKKGFSIRNLTVKKKITLFSVLIIVLILLTSGVGIWSSRMIDSARSKNYANYAMGRYYLCEAYGNFSDIMTRVRDVAYIYNDDTENMRKKISEMENDEKLVEQNLALFEPSLEVFDTEVENLYKLTSSNMRECMELCDKYVGMIENGNVEEARTDLTTNGTSIAAETEEELSNLMTKIDMVAEEHNKELATQVSGLQWIILGAAIVAFILTLVYSSIIIRSITVPIAKLTEAARKMAVGDVDVDCEKIADDDLGELMDNFKDMVLATKEQAEVASVIAAGDLTVDVKPRSSKDILGKALHSLIEGQNATLGAVRESTVQVTMGAEQVASASQSLAQGSTEQASALQEVTASIDEIAERTKKNATVATEANNLVHTVRQMANDGKEQMNSMVSAMTDISESSETISKIIKTIDDISFQTNILSLNAAVEAARAGIHGKGFAVVAEEVRNLAAKSASAAKETAEMIEDSIRKTGNGQKLAVETSEALDKIVESIESVTGLMTDMAESSNEQATAVSQIDQAITQVSTVVQTNSATSEECAAASEELSNQAASLKNQVASYKLTGGSESSVTALVSTDNSDSFGSDNYNEQLISLDDEFGKY